MKPTVPQANSKSGTNVNQAVPADGQQRILQLLGLAVRARHAVLGNEAVMRAIRSRGVKLVLLATDAGDNSRKKYRDKCDFYQLPLIELFDRSVLGQACGRSNMVAVAVTDPGFAVKLMRYVGELNGGDAFDKTSGV